MRSESFALGTIGHGEERRRVCSLWEVRSAVFGVAEEKRCVIVKGRGGDWHISKGGGCNRTGDVGSYSQAWADRSCLSIPSILNFTALPSWASIKTADKSTELK